ncbi:MAG: hypothetical protein IKL14_03350 [Alphaproteobacteria bacterium]|nr:hypothetical protein [Alphaproteobacteria bacterium]
MSETNTHKAITNIDIWNAIDEIARLQNISPSRLAIICGLDSTVFNKCKRQDASGHTHYPSFASLVKVLNKTNMTMTDFGIICDRLRAEKSDD